MMKQHTVYHKNKKTSIFSEVAKNSIDLMSFRS